MEQATAPAVDETPPQATAGAEAAQEAAAEALPAVPEDLDRGKVLAALVDVLVKVDGVDVPILDVIALTKCRPGKPLNGCQGRGFSMLRAPGATTAKLALCGCAKNAWRRSRGVVATPALTVEQAAQEESRDVVVRARVERKRKAQQEAETELAGLLEREGTLIGGLAQELATANAHASGARARAGEAKEWVVNLSQRIDELEKLKRDAAANEATATTDEQIALQAAAALEAQITRIKAPFRNEEKNLRRRIEKLGKRAERIIERHPEAAAAG